MKKLMISLLLFGSLCAMMPIDNFIATLSQKLESYYKRYPQEQAILIFNQEKYAASDTAFFQAYLVDNDFALIKGKRIITLAMIDANGKAVQKINFNVLNSFASNQLVISSDTPPGIYLFAVYPTETKEAEVAILFSQEISIVGKNKLGIIAPKTQSTIALSYEAGTFIQGIENKVIIQSSVPGQGKIKNSKNEEVAQFLIGQEGITSTMLTPQAGETYVAEINGTTSNHTLMAANDTGCVLRVMAPGEESSRNIRVTVPQSSELRKKELYLVVTHGKKITFSAPVALDANASFQATVSREYLKNGLNQATLFDTEGKVLAERIFFSNQSQVIASLTPSSKSYIPREKINIDVLLKDKVGNPIQGDFSISVYQKDLFQKSSSWTFEEEVLLKSLFKQLKKELPLSAMSVENRIKAMDDLLAGKSSGLISWADVLTNTLSVSTSVSNNLKLKGRAVFKDSDKPMPDSTLIMGYLQNAMIGYEAHTKKDGYFEMPFLYDFKGDDELFYMMEYRGKEMTEKYEIIPSGSILKTAKGVATTFLDSVDVYGEYIAKKKIVEQSYRFFASQNNKIEDIQDLNSRFEEEAMGTDLTVNVQNYIVFPTMEDLTREVIPFLQNKKKNNVASVRLLINQNTKNTNYITAKGAPLFLIDGVLTKDIDYFLKLKPVDILTIKIINDINKLNRLGLLGKNGVVLVKTKKSSSNNVIAHSTILPMQGLNDYHPPQFPDYSKGNLQRVPDLRATLYWGTFLSVNNYGKSQVSFYAADNIGTYRIIVKGMTRQGEPFEAEGSFDINFSKQE